jgi:hypothetical protein
MFSCFKDPLTVFRKAYDALAPGGYLEMQEIYFKPHSVDGSHEGTALQKVRAFSYFVFFFNTAILGILSRKMAH